MSTAQQRQLVQAADPASGLVVARCQTLGLSRSSFYYQPKAESALNLKLMRLLDKEFTLHNFKGVRGLRDHLRLAGYLVNEKRVRRLVRLMGHKPVHPKPRLSVPRQGVTPYPYLLRERLATAPNEVWSTNITYIPMAQSFLYLTAVLDWHSRYMLSWELSNTLDVGFCLQALASALRKAPAPYILTRIRAASLPIPLSSRPCWTPAAATAGAAPLTTPSSSASGARSSGNPFTSIPPTTATTCTSNYTRTLPTITSADHTKV
jgi:putative transposase